MNLFKIFESNKTKSRMYYIKKVDSPYFVKVAEEHPDMNFDTFSYHVEFTDVKDYVKTKFKTKKEAGDCLKGMRKDYRYSNIKFEIVRM